MAKRKKLNKRVAILLGAMGAVLVALALTVAIRGCGGQSIIDRLFPKDPKALIAEARNALKTEGGKKKNYVVAAKAFGEAIGAARSTNAPDIQKYYYEYGRMCHEWAMDANAVLTKTQRGERLHSAVSNLRRALNRDPKYVDAQRYLADIFWSLALASRGRGQAWNDYLKEADKLVVLVPDDHLVYYRRGLAKANLAQNMEGQTAKDAIADMEKAIGLKKDEVRYWLGLIEFFRRLDSRQDQVEKIYQRATDTVPNSAALLIAYADHLRREKKTDKAKQRLDDAIGKDPVQGTLALANYYVALGKMDDALATLEKVERLDKTEPQTYARQADIYSRRKENDKAVAVLKRGLAALEGVVPTQPTRRKRQKLEAGKLQLRYLLADVLLDMVQANDKNKDKLLEEARQCLAKMTATNVRAPLRAKIAGRIAFAEGKIEDAVRELEASYKAQANVDVRTANLLINIYLRQNLPGKADAILDRLLRNPRQQRNVSVLMAKARLLMRYRDFDKAHRYVSRVLQLDSDNAEALNTRMVILALRGESPALPANVKPTAYTIRMLLDRAGTLWLDGRQAEAARYVEQLYRRTPKDRTIINRLFAMYRALNRAGDAEKLLDEAIKHYPDDKALKARRQLVRETDWRKQREILMKMADEYPPLQRALEKAGIAIMFRRELGKQEAEGEHLRYLQEAARIDPNAHNVVDRLFRYALNKQDWKMAEECVGRAAKTNLDGSNGMFYKTRLTMLRQDYDGAIAAAQAVLKIRPNRKDARVLLGQAYLRKKMYDQAYEHFKTVADNDPGYPPALIGLAAVTQVQGKSTEHKAYVEAAHRLAPQDPYIRERYLEIERETASPEELIRQRERTLKRQPNDLRNILGLAFLYERVNRIKDAENMYVTFHQKSLDKLNSARVLCGFFLRSGRSADIERTIEPLLQTWKDRVGVLVLYGEILARLDPERAKGLFEKAITADVNDPRGHLYLARYWASQRRWSEAVDAMDKYVRRRPDDLAGAKELIGYYIEAGAYGPAEKRLDAILRSDPTDARAQTLRGALAMRQGQTKQAMAFFTEAIQDNPQYPYPLIHRARLHIARGEPNKAKSDLQAAKRLSRRTDVALQLAEVYESLRDYDNAELVYKEIRAERRNHVQAIDRLISIYSRRQKWRELEKLLSEVQGLFPNRAGYHMAEASMWHARDNVPKKLVALEKAVRVTPNAPVPVRVYLLALQEAKQHDKVLTVSQPYLEKPMFKQLVGGIRACSMKKLDRPVEAEKLFVEALETIQTGYILSLVHQLREAYGLPETIKKLKKWTVERAKNWRLYLVLGVAYAESEDPPNAVKALTTARDLTGKNELAAALSNQHLGASFYRLKRFREAEAAYLTSLKIRPDDIQVLNNLAYLYTNDLNQPKKALMYASRAARGMPNNAKVLDTFGWTLARLGKFADAEMALIRAVQLEKPLGASRYHLGWVYEQLGRLEEALKQYRQGFEMVRTKKDDPLYRPLKEALDRVRSKLKERKGSAK